MVASFRWDSRQQRLLATAVASSSDRMSTASISRRLSRWVAGLAYSDLPAEVRDRACGVTLQGLVSCLLGRDFPETIQAIRLVEEEEPGCGGTTTVLVDGRRFTRAGAAFIKDRKSTRLNSSHMSIS